MALPLVGFAIREERAEGRGTASVGGEGRDDRGGGEGGERGKRKMSDETVRFSVVCAMFQAMLRDRSSAKKRKRLRTFLDRVFTARDRYFAALRLILPGLDRERGTYGLKEHALAACLVDALGISKDSEDAVRLVNWRKGGPRSGANAGNFSLIATEVIFRVNLDGENFLLVFHIICG